MDNKKNNNISAKDVKILVAYHKPAVLVKNEILTPIHLGRALGNEISKDGALSNEDYQWMLDNMIGDDTGDNISNKNRRYNELTAIYWAWKNQDKLGNPKYIGLMHYRRQLVFNTSLTKHYRKKYKNSNKIVSNNDIQQYCGVNHIINTLQNVNLITPTPLIFGDTTVEYYKSPQSIAAGLVAEDIDLMANVVNKLYPDFNNVTNSYLNKKLHYFFNMFVMPVAEFNNYCQWLFNILFEIEKQIDYSNRNALQQRALGFLAERLTGIYITYLKQQHSIEHKAPLLHSNTDIVKPINPSFSNNNIPIVFSCDNNYAPYLAVAIQSIIENASSNNNYDIFILDEDFSQDTKNKILLQIKNKPNVNITFVAIKPYLQGLDTNIFYISGNISLATYYRFFIPRIFSNFSKIVYLDADLVVVHDVAELYHTNLQNKMLACALDIGVIDQFVTYVANTLKIDSNKYFNAGVLLLNITKANANNFEEACINKLNELKNPSFHDQDVLNALYQTDAIYLPLIYNLAWGPAIFSKTYLQQTHLPIVKEYLTAYKNPKIIHYASYKPWQAPHFPLANYFWQYAKNTPFYEEILFNNLYKHISHFVQIYNKKQLTSSNQVNNFFNFYLLTKVKLKEKKLLKYKILAKITFGKISKKYTNKYNEAKLLITREANAINNN